MFSMVLVAALTAGEAPAGGHGPIPFGVCYGACYGVGYEGWHGWGYAGHGWGYVGKGYQPGANWPGYACWGGCGGYNSPAFGHPYPPVLQPPHPRTYSGSELPRPDEKKPRDNGNSEKDDRIEKDDRTSKDISARAKLIVSLPAEGKLFVDGQPVPDPRRREFNTPALSEGRKYFYELRAELIRDGKTVTQTRRVILKAGDVIRADFSDLGSTAKIASTQRE